MPSYRPLGESRSTTDPTGRTSGSAARIPLCAATPDVVASPLQYAVAPKVTRAPGEGKAVISWRTPCRAAYLESRIVTSYSDANTAAANAVTKPFRQAELASLRVNLGIVDCRLEIAD